MSNDLTCPQCGGEPDEVFDLMSYGGRVRHLPVYRCCPPPPPTPAQLRRKADDDWLRRQRELAKESS